METVVRALAELVPHPMNAKTHDLELIKSSLQEFGQIKPIVVSGKSGYIVAGHGTRQAMLLLGIQVADVWFLDDLEPADELRLLAIDNKSGEFPNDKHRMHELIEAIRKDSQGLIGTGITEKFADRLAEQQRSGAEATAALFSGAGMDVDPAKPATLRVPMTQKQAEVVHEIIKRYAEENATTPGVALYEIVTEAAGPGRM